MDTNQDVNQADSSAATAGSGMSDGRPTQNIVGEFNRKIGSLAQKVDQLTNYLAAKETQAVSPTPSGTSDLRKLTDDQLWDESVKGNKDAFTLREQRQAAKVYAQMRAAESDAQLTQGQIGLLYNKYPVLRDQNHPLTQMTRTAYQALVRRGRPANDVTFKEAALTAIADRPDIVSDLHTQTARVREGSRRQGIQGQTGATHRAGDAPERVSFSNTKEDRDLANRMGVKDLDGAKKRFLERQRDGRSQFGLVASHIDTDTL